ADADLLVGSRGADTILGRTGNDVALMGAGNDSFVWNPGDGSDTIEGHAGADKMLFNGGNVSENIDISANGQRVRLFRAVARLTMDLNGVEQIELNALGGFDTVVVNSLAGTSMKNENINLSATGGAADAQ